MKKYTSTRNNKLMKTSKEAILQGICDDGGLFVLPDLKAIKVSMQSLMNLSYQKIAVNIFQLLLPDFTKAEIMECVTAAYKDSFSSSQVTPLKDVQANHILELFHGVTCAFKDVGLQMLPQLMKCALKAYANEKILILTATSGDTGKAALAGFCDIDQIGIGVFYPDRGVSDMQRLQMVSQEGKNVFVCGITGNFDDAQTSVKAIFQSNNVKAKLKKQNIIVSSANSINIGRLIPQIIYYFYAYQQMVAKKHIRMNEKINFCVPTGNFGNVLAGYYAKMLGCPIDKFIVACNENHVVSDFIQTGIYDRNRPFHKTISPSMDILISSNLERVLYYKSEQNDQYIKSLMQDLQNNGKFTIDQAILNHLQEDFYGGYCDDQTCKQVIKEVYKKSGYVLDPHSAVGYHVMQEYFKQDANTPCVLLATASPYKFCEKVYDALFDEGSSDPFVCMQELAKKTKGEIPKALINLASKPILHKDVIQPAKMQEYVLQQAGELFHD